MKVLFAIFALTFIHFSNTILAQNSNCNFTGTQWRIKNVVIKRTGTSSIEDSLYYARWHKNFDSARLCFYGNNRICVKWKKYKTEGKYKIVNKNEGLELWVLLKGLRGYDYGDNEKLSYGNFLLRFSTSPKYILNDCSFVMKITEDGLERNIFFEQLK